MKEVRGLMSKVTEMLARETTPVFVQGLFFCGKEEVVCQSYSSYNLSRMGSQRLLPKGRGFLNQMAAALPPGESGVGKERTSLRFHSVLSALQPEITLREMLSGKTDCSV